MIQSLIIAFSMFSRIPMIRIEWNSKNMRYVLCFLPMIGLIIGTIQYIVGTYGLAVHWNPLLFASIMTLIPVLITGGIHLDGFLDTLDAIHSYGDREKRLEILKDPHAGAFAIIGGLSYFVLSLGLWSALPKEALGVLCIGYSMSRTITAFSLTTFPLAKKTGLVAMFRESASIKTVRIVTLILLLMEAIGMILIQPLLAAGSMLTCVLILFYFYKVSTKKFGGITGDLAGYFLQLFEITMLIIGVVLGNIIF